MALFCKSVCFVTFWKHPQCLLFPTQNVYSISLNVRIDSVITLRYPTFDLFQRIKGFCLDSFPPVLRTFFDCAIFYHQRLTSVNLWWHVSITSVCLGSYTSHITPDLTGCKGICQPELGGNPFVAWDYSRDYGLHAIPVIALLPPNWLKTIIGSGPKPKKSRPLQS